MSRSVKENVYVFVVDDYSRGTPPRVETKPLLLDSFIPASMQIIAHITELMKFDLKPSTGGGITTTTTIVPPTRPHGPGVFAPVNPLGPEAYFSKGSSYEEYVEKLKHPSGHNYFDRYKVEEGRSLDGSSYSLVYGEVPQNLEEILGKAPSDLLRLVNTVEEVEEEDEDEEVQDFSRKYDDSDFRFQLLRQKKQPPTRAYVGLLSLYDMLNKESKKLGLNKYNGYSEAVLSKLYESSTGTSTGQLELVLSQISQRKDTKNPSILKRIDELVKDLQNASSYISTALRYIPPLPFML